MIILCKLDNGYVYITDSLNEMHYYSIYNKTEEKSIEHVRLRCSRY